MKDPQSQIHRSTSLLQNWGENALCLEIGPALYHFVR